MSLPLKWLRPCLRPQLRRASVAARRTYLDFYHSVRSYSTQQANDTSSSPDDLIHPGEVQILEGTPRVRTSTEEERYTPEPYPRIAAQKGVIDYEAFKKLYYGMRRGETLSEEVVVRGMSNHVSRSCGHRLMLSRKNQGLPGSRFETCLYRHFSK